MAEPFSTTKDCLIHVLSLCLHAVDRVASYYGQYTSVDDIVRVVVTRTELLSKPLQTVITAIEVIGSGDITEEEPTVIQDFADAVANLGEQIHKLRFSDTSPYDVLTQLDKTTFRDVYEALDRFQENLSILASTFHIVVDANFTSSNTISLDVASSSNVPSKLHQPRSLLELNRRTSVSFEIKGSRIPRNEPTNSHAPGPSQSLSSSRSLSPDSTIGTSWHWHSLLQALRTKAKRKLRPRIRPEFRRVEWTCTCGEELFRDFPTSAAIDGSYPYITAAADEGISSPTNQLTSIGQTASETSKPSAATARMSGSHPSLRRTRIPFMAVEDRPPTEASYGKRRFLELCVNTGNYTTTLGEIDVTQIQSDGDFFANIVDKYKKLRTYQMQRMFMKPVDIHFVFFVLKKNFRVSIRDRPNVLPPKDEVDKQHYEYICTYPPPMDRREFLHYFYSHADGHPDAAYINQFPKRLDSPLCIPQCSDTHGWGIHIIEGPNRVLLTWCCVVVLIISFVISVSCALLMKTQEQGFGIGQWLVAVLTTLLAALYFQWEES